MAFVPGFKHDVFVSYAHVDDQPSPGVQDGWVTTFVQGLRVVLGRKLGRPDSFSLWIDHRLSRHTEITPELLEVVQGSASLLVVLSRGFVVSDWCRKERNAFLESVRQRTGESAVFVVELDRLEEGERPAELSSFVGYRFWVMDREGRPPRLLGSPRPDASDQRYFDLLNDLGHDIADHLRRRLSNGINAAAPDPLEGRPTVFLADVTDDLEDSRDEVKRYLVQAGFNVLPGSLYSYESTAFTRSLEADLAKCKLFVQLLSGSPGKHPQDLPQGYLVLQHQRAVAVGKPILQWRSPDLDLTSVRDPKHREFLETETVRAVRLEELKAQVGSWFERKDPVAPTGGHDALVFLNAADEDQSLVQNISAVLDDLGTGYVLPLRSDEPVENRHAFEEYVKCCDALLIVYGCVNIKWVSDQLLAIRKLLWQRTAPLAVMAIFDGPPEQKPALNLKLPGMRVLACRENPQFEALRLLLTPLHGSDSL